MITRLSNKANRPVPRNLASGAALLVAIFTLAACGGASRNDAEHAGSVVTASADPVTEPNAVVVRVGGRAITRAMLAHALAAAVRFTGIPNLPPPLPPEFAACVKHLQAAAPSSGSSGAQPSQSELKSKCQKQYKELAKQALDPLISDQWVIGGAAEAGVHASDVELEQELKKAEAGHSQAQIEQELATSGRTLADFALETKVQLLGEGIRHLFMRKTQHVTSAQVASYYNEHKRLYGLPERRDLEIVRTDTAAQAQRVKREIASGKTVASIVSRLGLGQPIHSKAGLISGYEPHTFSQVPLDHAIFAAKPNVLSGPVRITLGYYLFEVKRLVPPVEKTLAQVQASIRPELPKILYKQALAAFIKAWRERWRARTDCQPGYVVDKCRQSRPPSPTSLEKEDLYTIY